MGAEKGDGVELNFKHCPSSSRNPDRLMFARNRGADDGLQSMCKDCSSEYHKRRREKNKARWDKNDPYAEGGDG